jgi:hypothetical protein
MYLTITLSAAASDLTEERARLLLCFGFRETVLDSVSDFEVALAD